MVRRFAVLAFLAGCYNPTVGVGGPCSPDGNCPSGQHCYGDVCLTAPPGMPDADIDAEAIDATLVDAGPDSAIDAPLDAFVSPTWLTATPIPGVNTASGETDPSFTPDRRTIVFSRSGELQIGTRANTTSAFTVTALTTLNDATGDDVSPEISTDGLTIYFTSDRGHPTNGDVYVSRKIGGVWAAPTLVTELTSTGTDDADVAISPDGLTAIVARGGTLLRSTRASTSAAWGTPASTGTAWGTNAASPAINMAGDVYFHANGTRDLFVARKMGASYATPMAITELNTATRDAAPFVSPDDLFLYFEHDADLLESRR